MLVLSIYAFGYGQYGYYMSSGLSSCLWRERRMGLNRFMHSREILSACLIRYAPTVKGRTRGKGVIT